MRFSAEPQPHVVCSGSWRTSTRGRCAGSGLRFGLSFGCWRVLDRAQRRELDRDRLEIGLDRLFSRLPCTPCQPSLRAANFQRLSTAISCVSCSILSCLCCSSCPGGQCARSGRRQIRAIAAHPSRQADHAGACARWCHSRFAQVTAEFTHTRIVACAPMRHHGKPISSACNCSWLIATCVPDRHSPRRSGPGAVGARTARCRCRRAPAP